MLSLLLALATPTQPVIPETSTARFDHVALHVADLEKSAAFYRRMFGLAEVTAPLKGARWFSLGGSAALHLVAGRTAPVADNRFVHLALAVDDFDAMIVRLRSANVPFGDFLGNAGAINRVRGDGVRQIFLSDLDGYWIEINDAAKQ